MALAVSYGRTKLNTTLTRNDNATLSNPTEGTKEWFLNLRLDNIELDQSTEANCSAGSGVAVITKDSGTFGDVRPGDLVTGDANIPAGSYIVSVDSTTQITIDQNTTGAVSGATLTINATGTKTLDSTFLGIQLAFTESANIVTITPTFHLYDGTANDDANNDGTDAETKSTSTSTITLASQTTASFQINLDTFLTNLRVARVNS